MAVQLPICYFRSSLYHSVANFAVQHSLRHVNLTHAQTHAQRTTCTAVADHCRCLSGCYFMCHEGEHKLTSDVGATEQLRPLDVQHTAKCLAARVSKIRQHTACVELGCCTCTGMVQLSNLLKIVRIPLQAHLCRCSLEDAKCLHHWFGHPFAWSADFEVLKGPLGLCSPVPEASHDMHSAPYHMRQVQSAFYSDILCTETNMHLDGGSFKNNGLFHFISITGHPISL